MKKINLETELLSENKELLTQQESFLKSVKLQLELDAEEDKKIIGTIFNNKMNDFITNKNKITNYNSLVMKYGDKLFHISQIKRVAIKYNLRFLNANMYVGPLDPTLASSINNFLKAENNIPVEKVQFKIMAPKNAFNLRDKALEDPLFFAELNDDYFVLIKKWGDDLSFKKRIISFLLVNWQMFFLLLIPLNLFILSFDSKKGDEILIAIICSMIYCFFLTKVGSDNNPKNTWNSEFGKDNDSW